jgi:hypothetical protein
VTRRERHEITVLRAHLSRLELIGQVTQNCCTRCGHEHPPTELRLTCATVPRLRTMARWTRAHRLWRAFLDGEVVEAICHACEGRMYNALMRRAS